MAVKMKYRGRMDSISMTLSLLCLVHCVALPVLALLLPVLGAWVPHQPVVEWASVLLTAGIGGWAIGKGYFGLHRSKVIVAGFVSGLLLLIFANLAAGELLEMVLKGLGSVLVIGAHLRNRAACRQCCLNGAPI